jgi:hypothetical protein
LFTSFADRSWAAEDLSELVNQLRPSVATILVYSEPNATHETSSGTGWFIGENEIVTNHHVIRKARRVDVRLSDGTIARSTKLLSFSVENDLAIIEVEKGKRNTKALPVSDALPRVGEKLVVIGSPLGLDLTVSDGIVSALPVEDKIQYIRMTVPISPGSSGSPVFSMNGNVVGIVVSSMVKGQALNYAIPAGALTKVQASKSDWKDWRGGNSIAKGGEPEDAEGDGYYDRLYGLYNLEILKQVDFYPSLWSSDGLKIGHIKGNYQVFQILDDDKALIRIPGSTTIFRVTGTDYSKSSDGQKCEFKPELVFIRTGTYSYTNRLGDTRTVLSFTTVDAIAFNEARLRAAAAVAKRKAEEEALREAERVKNLERLRSELAVQSDQLEKLRTQLSDLEKDSAAILKYAELSELISLYTPASENPSIAKKLSILRGERNSLGITPSAQDIESLRRRTQAIKGQISMGQASIAKLESSIRENSPKSSAPPR